MALLRTFKSIYYSIFPKPVRRFIHTVYPFSLVSKHLKTWLVMRAPHDEVYDARYFEDAIDPAATAAAPMIVASLMRELGPASVVDVGCGTGAILLEFQARGVKVLGLERAPAAIEILKGRKIDFLPFDVERDCTIPFKADLVMSTEVAEHLPEALADRFVELLSRISDKLAFTAATPGQGGTDHLNEQPVEYWIEKFERKGLIFQEELTLRLRNEWRQAGIAHYYAENLIVMMRPPGAAV